MKIAISELEHLREEIKNCHRIIKDLQKKREFVGLTDDEIVSTSKETHFASKPVTAFAKAVEAKLKEKNT